MSIQDCGNPQISPGGVQNEKIENSQTLSGHRSNYFWKKVSLSSIKFLFYANGDIVGSVALTSVFTTSTPYVI